MGRASLIVLVLVLLISLSTLSVLSNILTGYLEPQPTRENGEKRQGSGTLKGPPAVLFAVSPVRPQLFWRISSANYYTGSNWFRTTEEEVLDEFSQSQSYNATNVFTVEINISEREILLPLSSPNSVIANMSFEPSEGLEFYADIVADAYKAMKQEQAEKVHLNYTVLWRDEELNDRIISRINIPEEILEKYLQLPDIPSQVWELAKDLEDPSYSILDQVLADVQFLRTNFVYDVEASQYLRTDYLYEVDPLQSLYERITQGSDISSYVERRKGTCVDAATALAIILRIQGIPTRICIGYKPRGTQGGKLLYDRTGAHSVTEVYLPPYGWIQFDATPPLEEKPLLEVSPFKKESSPGSGLFCQLSITNRYKYPDYFKLEAHSKRKWNIQTIPEELWIDPLQIAYALLEVTIPDDADIGEKDLVTLTVASLSIQELSFSILAIIQAENILHTQTTTTLKDMREVVTRGDTLWVNGTVSAASDEQVDKMPVFVFMTKSREAEGVIAGKGYSKQGLFHIECDVSYIMEIGDYKVVSVSLGTTQYAPSSSDSIIRVRATTRMKLGSEEEFLLGYGAIHGRLLWDNGTGFARAPISLNITSLATPSEVCGFQNLTHKDGTFRIETGWETPGVYEVKAVFPGNEYALGSSAAHVVELKRGLPTIQILSKNTAVRGEVFSINGTIQFLDEGVWGEPVTLAFDDQLLATIETRDNGSYAWSFLVDSEETLGSHVITVALEKGNVSAVGNVVVKSGTTLTTRVSDVAGGMFLLLSASLFDDHDIPIRQAEVVINDYDLSWKTDNNGTVTFLLDAIKLWPEKLVLTARFEGSDLYLPVTTEKEVVLELVSRLIFVIPFVSPALIAIVFVCATHILGRRRTVQQTSSIGIVEERATIEEEFKPKPQKIRPLKILLPDVEAQFPNVWGVGDKLRIEISLDKNFLKRIMEKKAEVLIDGDAVASVRLSQQGCAQLSHVFIEKGEHNVQSILTRSAGHGLWNAEIRLRVVDYAEEIIRLYNEFLRRLDSFGINARNDMTSREIESLILRMGDFNSEALRWVTTLFEKAEYSLHLVARKDYEIMYLSLKELHINVEQEE